MNSQDNKVVNITQREELEQFKQELSETPLTPNNSLYQKAQQKTLTYRILFLLLGCLYLFLALFLYTRPFTWSYTLIFETLSLKPALSFFCSTAGIVFLYQAYIMEVADEALKMIIHSSKKQLKRLWEKKEVSFCLNKQFSFGQKYQERVVLTHLYKDTKEELEIIENTRSALLKEIENNRAFNQKKRELLLHEALVELEAECQQVINAFKKEIF